MRFLILLLSISCLTLSDVYAKANLFICGTESNDLVKLLKANGVEFGLYNNVLDAVKKAPRHSGVMVLGFDNSARTTVSDDVYRIAIKKNIRLYIEKPSHVSGVILPEKDQEIKLERGIVNTNKLQGLDSLDVLGIYDHNFIPLESKQAVLLLGRVAGYDKADYGIDDVTSYALLFHHHDNVLISTLNLSDFVKSRFGPAKSWEYIFKYIFSWLKVKNASSLNHWGNDVSPAFDRAYQVKKEDFVNAVSKGANWFYHAKLFVHPSWESLFQQRTAKDGVNVMYPPVADGLLLGNGELGILEGHGSKIYRDGSQPVRWWMRADCQAETAFALSLSGNYLNRKSYQLTSSNLLNYLYKKSNLRDGPRNDPDSPSYGLIGWATTDADAYYGDDNARVILGTIGAAVGTDNEDWNKYIAEAIIGNFRTTGKNGFRRNWFRDHMIQKAGWQNLAERDLINVHPHYESWLWATYLWLYDKTGYQPLLEKAKRGISITMEKYPDWKWTNGIQQERARMILPLSWLVRVENTSQHRAWLKEIATKLLENLQESGAIREELGKDGQGRYGKIKSNAEYGLHEAPLISENGDPVADLLYTTNFAFFALNEAYAATNDVLYKDAVKKIADFMVKVQVKSDKHKDLDGAWYRAFDYKRWDYWASNADSGWGPWGTLTGWTQSWILTTLIMVDRQQNFWDYSKKINENGSFKQLSFETIEKMLTKNNISETQSKH